MVPDDRTRDDLLAEIDELRYRLEEAEETLRAISSGEVDALVVSGSEGEQVFTLKGAEQPYRVLVESMNEGAATLATDGTILYCNKCLAAMLQVPLERLIGTRLDAYVAPADRPLLTARLECCALDCSRQEIALINEEGTTVPVLFSCYDTDLSSGGGISVVITDLRQQKRNEEMMASERLARSIIEQAGEAILICGEDGRVIRASWLAHQLCGKNPLLKPFDELLHLRISETDCLFSVVTPLHGGCFKSVEVELNQGVDEVSNLLLNASPLMNDHNRIIGCVVSLSDITEHKKADEALVLAHAETLNEKNRLEAVMQALPVGLAILDVQGGNISSNSAFEQVWGSPCAPVSDIDDYAVYQAWWTDTGQLVQPHEWASARAVQYGDTVVDQEMEIQRFDGTHAFVLNSAAPTRDIEGRITGCAVAIMDISERKHAEEALNRAHGELEKRVKERTMELKQSLEALQNEVSAREKLERQLRHSQKLESIGLLAGGVAHDFNNLLTGIGGYAQLIQDFAGPDPELQESVAQLMSGVDRAAELTRNLLAFSRKQELKRQPAMVDGIIDKAGKFIRRVIGEDIEFRTVFGGNDLRVLVDTGQIEQVLLNLAINARDAMPLGGCLTISIGRTVVKEGSHLMYDLPSPGNYVRISVTDTGSGIDRTAIERIFEPFYTTKEVGKGTGLGLSIVHGIIKQHDGSILVSSESARGATFDIYLPLVEERESREETKMPAPVAGGTETLLLAEDEEIVKTLLKRTLEKAGYRVVVAADGNEALARFGEHDDIALVISDVIMPGKNGKEILAEIREVKPGMKFIFISGYTADIIRERGMDVGKMDAEIITKPFSKNDLLRKVREVLDRD